MSDRGTIQEVAWRDVAEECEALGARHHPEVTAGREGAFALNRDLMAALADSGFLRVFVARVAGYVVGYCLWTKDVGLEVRTARGMTMGPYYVAPEHARLHLGWRMLIHSRDVFRAEGVETMRLHHMMHGRSIRLGAMYERLGAEEYERHYLLRLQEG
jgi:GNAT superfamily N-acetyltransferase